MLIPVGLDDSKVSRVPIVSIGIVALCVLAYVLSFTVRDEADEAVTEVIRYFYTHRGLELPEDFKKHLGVESGEDVRDADGFGGLEDVETDLELVSEDVDQEPVAEETQEQQKELNRLAGIAVEALDNRFETKWGYVPAKPRLVSLLTSMFLHGGILHLFGNMLFLYFTAPFLEDRWGRPFFAGFYLLGGIVATLGFSLTQSASLAPLIGASGAISAVMGAFAVKLGSRRMRFLLQTGFLRYTFESPAWVILPMFFALDLGHALSFGSGTGVAYWAHVWGFVFGSATAYGVKSSGYDRRLNTSIFDPDYPERHPVQGADHLLRAGKSQEALKMLGDCFAKMPDYEEVAEAYWNLAVQLKDAPHAQRVGRYRFAAAVRGGSLEDSLLYWNTLSERFAPPLEGPDLSRLTELMVANKRGKEAMKVLWSAFTAPEADQYGANQYMALTVAATKISPDAAREIADQALTAQLNPNQRKYMESVVAWADQIAAAQTQSPTTPSEQNQTPAAAPIRLSDD